MNKKLLFTTALSFVALGCVSAVYSKTCECNAIDPEQLSDGLLNIEKIEAYNYDDGEKTLCFAKRFTNNAAGYRTEVYEDDYDNEEKKFLKSLYLVYTYDENNRLLNFLEKSYDEVKEEYKDKWEETYEYFSDGSLKKHIEYKFDASGSKNKTKEYEYTYNSANGLVESYYYFSTQQGEAKDIYNYDNYNNCSKVTTYKKNAQQDWARSVQQEYLFDENNDKYEEKFTSYDVDNGTVFASYDYDYEYYEPHKLKESVRTIYENYDGTRTNIESYEKNSYSYSGNDVIRISSSSDDGQNYNESSKLISCKTKDVEYRIIYSKNAEGWQYNSGEKTEFVYKNGVYMGYLNSISEDEGTWEAEYGEEITYVLIPESATDKGISIGLIIGIVVGGVAVVYFTGFALWKKSVSFLTKPVFGKVYGWLDKIFKKKQ